MPTIMFLDENRNKCFKDVDEQITLGKRHSCQCVLPAMECIDERHIIIYKDNGEYYAKNLSIIIVSINGVTLNRGDKKSLGASSNLCFGQSGNPRNFTVVTWEDKSKKISRVTGRQNRVDSSVVKRRVAEKEELPDSKIESMKLSIRKEKNKSVDGEVEYLRERFYIGFQNLEANAKKVCDYITKFMQENFSSFTVVIFRKLGGRWRGVSSKRLDKREEYGPARQIFFKAISEKVPILAKIRKKMDTEGTVDIGGQQFEASMTVINIPVNRVIYVPLLQGNECFGVLYLDSQDRDIDERDLEKITRLFNDNGITGILSGYLIDDKWELNYLKTDVKPHKVRDWKFKIMHRNIHYPVTSHTHCAGMGISRVIYGHCGDNLSIATKVKSYLQALADQNDLMKPYNYLNLTRKFAYKLSSDINASMVDFYYKYPVPSTSDLEDEYSLKTIGIEDEEDDLETTETHDVQIDWCGSVHIYVGKKGIVSKLSLETTQKPINLIDFHVGDFVLASTFQLDMYKLQKCWEKKINFSKILSDTFKDFCVLVREK